MLIVNFHRDHRIARPARRTASERFGSVMARARGGRADHGAHGEDRFMLALAIKHA